MRNLVENAIRHTPRGGKVIVAVGQPAMLAVSDDGPGIAPAERRLVFQRFWRRNHDTGGHAGLGLAIVAKIAELHGGTVEISDAPTGGARFSMTLIPAA